MINLYKEIYLMLTNACPNRCEYCYIKHRDKPSKMTIELAEDILKKCNPDRVIFFGGEPLLELDMIKYIVKKYYNQLKFQVVTSTTVNFKEFVKFNKQYPLNEIQLSWDGFNKNRLNYKGEDTSLKTYNNILYAMNEGMKFDIKCVISDDNVHQLEDIHNTFKDFKNKNISGQFVIAHRDLYIYEFYKQLEYNLIKTFDLDKMYKMHLNYIMAYLNKDYNFSSCDGGKYSVFDSSGHQSFCTALSQENINITSDLIQEPSKDEECISCEYKYMCDGGCRYERYHAFKDQWQYKHLESTCKMVKIWIHTIEKFLSSLDDKQKDILLYHINRYKEYTKEYFKGRE